MNILLSEPDLYFDKRIEAAAQDAGCYAFVRWSNPREVRFVLLDKAMGVPASSKHHDEVIARLFMLDPQARIRTARITYDGAAAFYQAKGAPA